MKAKIEKIKDRVWINFSDFDRVDSLLMEEFVNISTQFIDDMIKNNCRERNQFSGQGCIRFNGVRVQDRVTTHITFQSPFEYTKTSYKYSFKERIKILFHGSL